MPETIGQRLKQIRLSRQLSIEKAAEATRVRVVYLQALEEDNYSAMSSAAQGRGFLRLYADFLGLDLESAMTDLRQGGTVDAPPEAPAPVAAPQTPPASPADGKPGRGGFWSRLLRRPVPAPAAQLESAPAQSLETLDSVKLASSPRGEPAPAQNLETLDSVKPASSTQGEPAPARAKKTAAASSLAKHPEGAKGGSSIAKRPEGAKGKKAKAPVQADKPKSKPRPAAKTTAKITNKKKASLKNRQ